MYLSVERLENNTSLLPKLIQISGHKPSQFKQEICVPIQNTARIEKKKSQTLFFFFFFYIGTHSTQLYHLLHCITFLNSDIFGCRCRICSSSYVMLDEYVLHCGSGMGSLLLFRIHWNRYELRVQYKILIYSAW